MNVFVAIDKNRPFWNDLIEAAGGLSIHLVIHEEFERGMRAAASNPPAALILNAETAAGDLGQALIRIRQVSQRMPVIVLADEGNPADAEAVIRNGAWDYSVRPGTSLDLAPHLKRLNEHISRSESSRLRSPAPALHFDGIAGTSVQLKSCLNIVARAADSDANVLIKGETGTGKELIALAIHHNGKRSSNNFVVVDCAALPETLVESTLLGYERGAFTGADRSQTGLIKQADGGTLFLDEVGELPLSIQKSFLRVIQEHRFRPVGGSEEVTSDFRLISATNRNLDEMVAKKLFRQDLLFRLRSFGIEVPPLRERPEDIDSIVMHHLPLLCKRMEVEVKEISQEFFNALHDYSWPGNARELVNALDRAVAASREQSVILTQHLPTYLRIQLARAAAGDAGKQPGQGTPHAATNHRPSLLQVRTSAIEKAEDEYLRELMTATNGNIHNACVISGVSRSRLYFLLKKYGIPHNHAG